MPAHPVQRPRSEQLRGTDTSTLKPFIDPSFDFAFGDTTTAAGIAAGDRLIDAQYASTTNYVFTTMLGDATMFGVNFIDGRIKGYPSARKLFYVRCVRGNAAYGQNRRLEYGQSDRERRRHRPDVAEG